MMPIDVSILRHHIATFDVVRSVVGVQARFRWFEAFAAHSEFYLLVAKPLVSMRTVGSIVVERQAQGQASQTYYSNKEVQSSTGSQGHLSFPCL
jgi:hypothetical protein